MIRRWSECVLLASAWACAHGKVVNGYPASVEDYPHVVTYGSCMATLISEFWVLSAAHCKGELLTLRVLALPIDFQKIEIRQSVTHPKYMLGENYDANGYRSEVWATWDYMLMELVRPLRVGTYLSAFDVVEPPTGTKVTFPSENLYGVYEKSDEEITSPPLYQGELFTISDEECARRLQSFDSVTMMCARGHAPKHCSACHGDSGSGLVAQGRLLGVLSWVEGDARGCGADRIVVSARLSSQPVQEWIRNVTSVVQWSQDSQEA